MEVLDKILFYSFIHLQHYEIDLNYLAQKILQPAEPFLVFLSTYFSSGQLLDVIVPFIGVFQYPLMLRLVCALGVICTCSSFIKWIIPEYRPYWWTREYVDWFNTTTIRQHVLTCETTAGFPSNHCMTFTAFVYIIVAYCYSNKCSRLKQTLGRLGKPLCYGFISVASVAMWLSRMYLGTQFLHQCIAGSVMALLLLHFFNEYAVELYIVQRLRSVLTVLFLGMLPVASYYAMHSMELDPHWSVRMAFKWCSDPMNLRLEASPIFLLGRDFGYLMGVALSAPLYRSIEAHTSLSNRMQVILLIEVVNHYARIQIPKNRGRFVFIAYEFTRNMVHSYGLISVVSKIP